MKCNILEIKINDDDTTMVSIPAKVGTTIEKILKSSWSKLKLDAELTETSVSIFDGETNEQLAFHSVIEESITKLSIYTKHATKA
jgi:hypothetical protein